MEWLRFLGTMRSAVTVEGLFPGRPSTKSAPGGSQEAVVRASVKQRLSHEHQWFQFSHHSLPVTNLKRPISILHLTDVHIRQHSADLETIARMLRDVRPDLTLITGDIVTKGWTEEAVAFFLDALPPAPLGRFAVMGNWEYWTNALPQPWKARLQEHGVTLLREEWQDVGPVVVAGTDDQWAGTPDPVSFCARLPKNRPIITMTHSPDLFPQLCTPDVALVLAGHTHGGQVRLPRLGAIWSPKGTGHYVGGWYRHQSTHLFVSRGLGWSVAPLRLYCPPELAWITLTPAP